MTNKIFSVLKIITLATVLSFGLSYVYAWTAPSATPPTGNVSAPINSSDTAQTKTGGLNIATVTGNVGIGTSAPASALHLSGDRYATFGPNSTWGGNLQIGGNGRVTTGASVAATNGNLHLDAKDGGYGMYLNWYSSGATGVLVGNGVGGYGPVYTSDVYVSSAGKWASQHPAMNTNPIVVNDGGGGWDGSCPAGYAMTGIKVLSNRMTLRCAQL